MDYKLEAKIAIQKIAGVYKEDRLLYVFGSVVSVNTDSNTCVIAPIGNNISSNILNVLLQADVSDGLELIPAIDSTVVVMWSVQNQPYIALYSELEEVNINANNLVNLQDGSFGGIAKVEELTTKLNNLENLVNDLVVKYNTHTHAVSGAVAVVTTNIETTVLTPTIKSDIENTKVNHGI